MNITQETNWQSTQDSLKDKLKTTPDAAITKIPINIPIRSIVKLLKKIFKNER